MDEAGMLARDIYRWVGQREVGANTDSRGEKAEKD